MGSDCSAANICSHFSVTDPTGRAVGVTRVVTRKLTFCSGGG